MGTPSAPPFPAVPCDELAALMIGKGRDDLVFTDLFDADLDAVADSLDAAIRSTADALRTSPVSHTP
ncbi:hypothetical protein D2E66_02420 [Mycobacteroides abscessus]|nr:hypothetical protein D2E66_02420 [Mycobacteroides abscessus]